MLDTNVIIGILKGTEAALVLVQNKGAGIGVCAYSSVTRMELLSFPDLTADEEQAIVGLLGLLDYCPITPAVENAAIALRRAHRLKLPDAIVAATAQVNGLELLTLDKRLANKQP